MGWGSRDAPGQPWERLRVRSYRDQLFAVQQEAAECRGHWNVLAFWSMRGERPVANATVLPFPVHTGLAAVVPLTPGIPMDGSHTGHPDTSPTAPPAPCPPGRRPCRTGPHARCHSWRGRTDRRTPEGPELGQSRERGGAGGRGRTRSATCWLPARLVPARLVPARGATALGDTHLREMRGVTTLSGRRRETPALHGRSGIAETIRGCKETPASHGRAPIWLVIWGITVSIRSCVRTSPRLCPMLPF